MTCTGSTARSVITGFDIRNRLRSFRPSERVLEIRNRAHPRRISWRRACMNPSSSPEQPSIHPHVSKCACFSGQSPATRSFDVEVRAFPRLSATARSSRQQSRVANATMSSWPRCDRVAGAGIDGPVGFRPLQDRTHFIRIPCNRRPRELAQLPSCPWAFRQPFGFEGNARSAFRRPAIAATCSASRSRCRAGP